jgi:hypothetical protein
MVGSLPLVLFHKEAIINAIVDAVVVPKSQARRSLLECVWLERRAPLRLVRSPARTACWPCWPETCGMSFTPSTTAL